MIRFLEHFLVLSLLASPTVHAFQQNALTGQSSANYGANPNSFTNPNAAANNARAQADAQRAMQYQQIDAQLQDTLKGINADRNSTNQQLGELGTARKKKADERAAAGEKVKGALDLGLQNITKGASGDDELEYVRWQYNVAKNLFTFLAAPFADLVGNGSSQRLTATKKEIDRTLALNAQVKKKALDIGMMQTAFTREGEAAKKKEFEQFVVNQALEKLAGIASREPAAAGATAPAPGVDATASVALGALPSHMKDAATALRNALDYQFKFKGKGSGDQPGHAQTESEPADG